MTDRKHLTAREIEKLITATKGSRNEARNRCFLLLMFRHGLRVSEACALTLSQVDTESRVLHVARLKKGLSTTHPPADGRIARDQGMACRAQEDETGNGCILH
ncbi:tyrosine-type recombinase/integrase [Candidatus Methylobacter favarea]|uniref:tyrosine-type recombinase/integrase n=1 Tax=Candidatus Methylobacter favarea TaxID=2707345 RepID=UPI003CCCB323